ncbi:MAG: hypothetical protein FRX49_03835 [Trebouxia sp. A1-2]|nr:MAG: hypothetical protein FRX49_03835 [Trebouxia sp. A1-2]
MDYARLLPWLAWTLLTYTCADIAGKRNRNPFKPADAAAAASTEAAAGTDLEWTEPAVQHYIDDLVYQGTKAPQVLMVLDPNGVMCWEDVGIDDFSNATLLPWLHSQHDALTLSNYDRSGKLLQASSRVLKEMPAGLGPGAALTFREHIEDSTDSQTGSQLPRLPPSHLKLTTVESFWTSVETSAAMSKPLPATVNYIQSNNPDEPLLLSLKKTVIILPRIVTMIRPIGSKTKRLAKNHVWNDTAAWDQDVLLTMLGKFVNLTGAKTIPSLAEYRILPDKVQLHQMYQSYHDADPDRRTPPIPTAQVKLPLPSERLQQLCYSDLNSTESERRAVANSLLGSLQHLEASVAVDSALRRVVEGGGVDWMGQYMIKREFSEGAYHVFGIVMPDLRSSWPTKQQSSHQSTTQLAEHDSDATHPAKKPATTSSCDEEVYHNPNGIHKHLNAAVRAFHKGQGLESPPPGCSHADPQPDVGMHMGMPSQQQLPAELVKMLDVTADRLLKESCGEGWLLQPRIADMTRLEYRVYLLGGAQAVSRSSDDSIVVYTPALLDPEAGIRTFNITLPEGTFCSDVMIDPSQDVSTVKRGEFSQLTPWRSPETYDLIIKAAQDGAHAIVNSPEGHFMRTVNNVFIRVDVVLGAQWLSNDEVLLHPMVNEMDWLNSAGMLATFWKKSIVSSENAEQQRSIIADTLKRSAGYKIAHALMSEVMSVYTAKDKPL